MYPEPSGPWARAVETDASQGAFLSVWGPSEGDVWAVGGQVASIGDAGQGMIQRRTDGSWATAEVPADTPLLNWVHGAGDELWTVGNAGAALRYDGSAWQAVDTGVDVPLWGVFVFASDDVWAVGGDAFDRDTMGIVLHYDGSTWSPAALPTLDRDSAAMFKVFGVEPDDVHVVGAAGVLLHYDGSSWTQEPSGTANDMISLWGNDADDIVAVGGRAIGTIARWDGAAWTVEEVGALPGLNGVWMDPEGRVSIVGNNGLAAVIREGFDADPEDSTVSFEVLHAVFGLDDGTRISVGGTLNSSPPYRGLIIENAP
ncbi:MAG: hypothetical protein ACE37F_13955 [Nannocystaceae bacterium]|nr:hypothetical protein [bacterium]